MQITSIHSLWKKKTSKWHYLLKKKRIKTFKNYFSFFHTNENKKNLKYKLSLNCGFITIYCRASNIRFKLIDVCATIFATTTADVQPLSVIHIALLESVCRSCEQWSNDAEKVEEREQNWKWVHDFLSLKLCAQK